MTPLTIVRTRDSWADFTERLHGDHMLVIHEWGDTPVTIGAPHHAPYGRRYLRSGRVADANTGLLARNVAARLRGRAVVACDAAEVDVNKPEGWGYGYLEALFEPHKPGEDEAGRLTQVLSVISGDTARTGVVDKGTGQYPRLVLELHGHNAPLISRTIEITTRGDVVRARLFAHRLEQLVAPLGLRVAVIGRDALVFGASACETLRVAHELGIEAYHVAVPAIARWNRGQTYRHLPKLGVATAHALSEAVRELLGARGGPG